MLSHKGFIVSARLKHIKSHREVDAINEGIDLVRKNVGAPEMAYVHMSIMYRRLHLTSASGQQNL
jgi:hypothetical protein